MLRMVYAQFPISVTRNPQRFEIVSEVDCHTEYVASEEDEVALLRAFSG